MSTRSPGTRVDESVCTPTRKVSEKTAEEREMKLTLAVTEDEHVAGET